MFFGCFLIVTNPRAVKVFHPCQKGTPTPRSLKCIDPEKAPGTDRLPAEGYKTFWDEHLVWLVPLTMHLIMELFRCHREEKSLNLYQNSYSKRYQRRSDGFLKGRFIGKNSTLIDITIDNSAEQQPPGLLLFNDFKVFRLTPVVICY